MDRIKGRPSSSRHRGWSFGRIILGKLIFVEQAANGSFLGAGDPFLLLPCAPVGNCALDQGTITFKVHVVLDEVDKGVVTKASKLLDSEVQSEQGAFDRE